MALAVVYDTSGSMASMIRAEDGRKEPKHIIARRAFGAVVDRLERFVASDATGAPAKRLDLSVVVFKDGTPEEALPMAAFDPATVRRWLGQMPPPQGGTPLGDSMARAGAALQQVDAGSRHLLVLTDGANTAGNPPEAVLDALFKQSMQTGRPVFVHVLALDIPPRVFTSLRDAGANLVGAADEKQLQTQLDFILENQILVEAP